MVQVASWQKPSFCPEVRDVVCLTGCPDDCFGNGLFETGVNSCPKTRKQTLSQILFNLMLKWSEEVSQQFEAQTFGTRKEMAVLSWRLIVFCHAVSVTWKFLPEELVKSGIWFHFVGRLAVVPPDLCELHAGGDFLFPFPFNDQEFSGKNNSGRKCKYSKSVRLAATTISGNISCVSNRGWNV